MLTALAIFAALALLEVLYHHGALDIYIPRRRRHSR
jgi:hypothetical protein